MDSWAAVLDEMERRLEVSGRAMDRGEYRFEPVAVPASLGPLPPEERDRAERVHRGTVDAGRRVEAAMAAMAGQIRRPSAGSSHRPPPALIDRRA